MPAQSALTPAVATTASSFDSLARPRAATGRHDYLLLLSHMRSYSSLLAHLLGTSPEINGYGEMLLRYRTRLDLWRLRSKIRKATGAPLQGRWLLDKVLHNHIRPLDRWLPQQRVRAVIFVRRPVPTLQSMLTLAAEQRDAQFRDDPQRCCDYYVSRLHRLREDAHRLGDGAVYFDAEALVDRPQPLLSGLSHWLGLQQPLAPRYTVGRRSGEVGFGDPSANIRSGCVLPATASTIQRDWVLPKDVVAEAEAAYRRCRDVLMSRCRVLAA